MGKRKTKKANIPTIRIGMVGGGDFCKEFIEKTLFYSKKYVDGARIVAVADPDPEAPGMALAREMGLTTVSDYHDLYKPEHRIDLIIDLVPDDAVFTDILETKPVHIRLLSNRVFRMLWKTVTEQEKELRYRTRELMTIFDGIQDFILVITPERRIVEANRAFLDRMGYSREQVVGRSCHEVFQNISEPCAQGDIVCPLSEVIRNRRVNQQVLTRVDHNGEVRYVEVTMFPIWESDGKISRFVEISRDITDRKREEEEITRRLERMVEERTRQLQESHEKLLHQDKMASLGKLSASVVHEINNPISGILNLLALIHRILEEKPLGEAEIAQFKSYVQLMETETRRISRIVSNLLAFSRQSKLSMRQVDLNRIIEKALLLNANLLKINRIKVNIRLDPHLPPVTGSEDHLQQIMMNLISNAAEAMEVAGGTLTLETFFSPGQERVVILVKDTGVGIPKENQKKLFEPFFTTKRKGKGVGLGLSVVYGIIQECGGSISVSSEVGKGATFQVELPLNHRNQG